MDNEIKDGGPAFPVHDMIGPQEYQYVKGMSLRQYAAIQLRVPDSGLEWLDKMILAAKRDEFAGQALAGELASQDGRSDGTGEYVTDRCFSMVSVKCYRLADAIILCNAYKMLAERDK